MKKIAAVFMSLLFSLAASLGMAQTSTKTSSKKWDPTDKPAALKGENKIPAVLYNEKGELVDLENKEALAGVTLHDEEGNNYQVQKGQIIKLDPKRAIQKRVGPGIVA
jgi:hypothetical protein